MTADQTIILSGNDLDLLGLDALRAEVARLRPIASAAEYAEVEPGHAGCVDPDRDCDEYTDDQVEWCSHVTVRHATYAHVQAHNQLAYLVRDVRRMLLDLPGAEEVLEHLQEGLCAIVANLQGDVDTGADEVAEHPVYVTAVKETDEDQENDRG